MEDPGDVLPIRSSRWAISGADGDIAGPNRSHLQIPSQEQGTTMNIEFRNVSFAYSKKKRSLPVLDSVTFEVEAATRAAIVGKSGSGKSTVLDLISGVLLPQAGQVVVGGTDLTLLTQPERAQFRREHVGYVFQDFRLFEHLPALDNVSIAAQIAGVGQKVATAKARNLLERVGLGRRMEHLPSELSGGEKQRVSIARALINEPVLILADEPTGALDAEVRDDILNLLAQVSAESTLVVVTHDPYVAEHLSARIIRCVDGTVLA